MNLMVLGARRERSRDKPVLGLKFQVTELAFG